MGKGGTLLPIDSSFYEGFEEVVVRDYTCYLTFAHDEYMVQFTDVPHDYRVSYLVLLAKADVGLSALQATGKSTLVPKNIF